MSDLKRREPRPVVGDHVIFHDSVGKPHHASVTAVWDQDHMIDQPMINCVYVSSDATKKDDYGRQIARATSLSHGKVQFATYGYYWIWPDETPNPVRAPSSV